MSWANNQWNEWGAARGWYKGGLSVDGTAQYVCQDVQLKYAVGAITEGTITVIEPLNLGADNEVWRLEISLPGYTERWEATKSERWGFVEGCHSARSIKSTYLQGNDAAKAGMIISSKELCSVEDIAIFAAEYLHELDPKIAYPAFRQAMRHF